MSFMLEEAHDYTHKAQFERDVKNEDHRYIIREIMDLVVRMSVDASEGLPFGFYVFDMVEYLHRVEGILGLVSAASKVTKVRK